MRKAAPLIKTDRQTHRRRWMHATSVGRRGVWCDDGNHVDWLIRGRPVPKVRRWEGKTGGHRVRKKACDVRSEHGGGGGGRGGDIADLEYILHHSCSLLSRKAT